MTLYKVDYNRHGNQYSAEFTSVVDAGQFARMKDALHGAAGAVTVYHRTKDPERRRAYMWATVPRSSWEHK